MTQMNRHEAEIALIVESVMKQVKARVHGNVERIVESSYWTLRDALLKCLDEEPPEPADATAAGADQEVTEATRRVVADAVRAANEAALAASPGTRFEEADRVVRDAMAKANEMQRCPTCGLLPDGSK